MPQHNVDHPGVVSRPLVEPTLWREVNQLTCKERANGEGLDTLVQEATGMAASSAAVPAAGRSLADNAR
jgi:LysR family hydrogen peroxide-inducible transcriptional activator